MIALWWMIKRALCRGDSCIAFGLTIKIVSLPQHDRDLQVRFRRRRLETPKERAPALRFRRTSRDSLEALEHVPVFVEP